jgi:hypothetical protein
LKRPLSNRERNARAAAQEGHNPAVRTPAWFVGRVARVLLTLAVLSAVVFSLNQFALPRGLRPALNLRGASQAYTHQIAGYIQVPADGAYRLALVSSGRARLAVDDRLVASLGARGKQEREPEVVPHGVHRVTIQYTPEPPRAAARPELRWSRNSDSFVPVPSDALAPRGLRAFDWQARRWLSIAALALSVAWAAAAIWIVAGVFRRWIGHELGAPGPDPALTALLALTLVLHAYPLWWGLPNLWAQDELEPIDVLIGLREGFSGGWHMKYPPLHVYFLAVLYLPTLGFVESGLLESGEPAVGMAFVAINRALTVVMSLGTTALVYVCGRILGLSVRSANRRVEGLVLSERSADRRVEGLTSQRAAVLGALVWILVLPLTYYAKLANLDVPYTFWFALSLVGYVRGATRGAMRDFVLFGASAAAAVATKDQAYGLYLLPALHLAWTRYRTHAAAPDGSGLARTLRDRALLSGTAAGVAVFALAHNLPFNWTGFKDHVAIITGGASADYRQVESLSAGGQFWLLRRTIEQMAWSMSVPGLLVACAGVIAAIRRRTGGRQLLMLLVPVISYYLTFIAVVGYVYDRFLLPVCAILAIFAGHWIDGIWRAPAARWKTAGVVALFAYMTWRTASIDVLMAADRRYEAEAWMRANLPPGSVVGVLEWRQLLPDLGGFRVLTLPSPPDAADRARPNTLVVSGGYAKRYPGRDEARWYDAAIRGERGYRVALRVDRQHPLAILARERPFREMETQFTILPKVSPEIVILVRQDSASEGNDATVH